MAFRHKLLILLLIVGLVVLGATSAANYRALTREAESNQADRLRTEAADLARSIDQALRERAKKVIILANSPPIVSSLIADNARFSGLTPRDRSALINDLEAKWVAAKTDRSFGRTYLSNPAADFLKRQQDLFPGDYGELFLTNRYGALVASTARLTTFSQGDEYWWQGAYAKGRGMVFLDDRGYDKSADSFVLGLVVPIKRDGRIIGLLKCSLNVARFFNPLMSGPGRRGETALVRSSGAILFQPGTTPLSRRVEEPVRRAMSKAIPARLRIKRDQSVDQVALCPVGLSTGQVGYAFGGRSESGDHISPGQTWFVAARQSVEAVRGAIWQGLKVTLATGAVLLVSLMAASFFIGRSLTKPLTILNQGAVRVGRGDLDGRIEINSRDELGRLAESFNRMIHDLQSSMASRRELEKVVAELKQAQKGLRAGTDRWQNTFDAISDVICLLDPDHAILQINQAGCRVIGLSREELIGRKCFEVLPICTTTRENCPCAASLVSGRHESCEVESQGRYLEREAWPLIGPDGRVESVTHIVRDVTARKKVEIELAKSEETYRLLAENHNTIVIKLDPQGQVTYCNRYAAELFGYTVAEMLGRGITDLICPEVYPGGFNVEEFWADLLKNPGNYSLHENENISRDGSRLWISWTNTPVYNDNGELVELISTGVNATESREARQRLEESEERFRAVVENVSAAIYVVMNGRFVFSNPAGNQLVGLENDQILSRPIGDFVPPDEIDRIVRRHRLRLNGQIIGDVIEHRLKIADGSEKWVQTSGTMINWRGSKAILAFVMDITFQRTMESEKERLEAQLLQAHKMEALGTLAGGIAHDFNNILAAIIGYSELALEDARDGRIDDEQITKILMAGLRAKELVTQILTFSRKVEPNMKPIDLNRVVKQTELMIERIIPKMVSVEHRLAADLWLVNADAGQITQVLMNLCTNANDAMPDGGRLIIETGNIVLDEEYCRSHAGSVPGEYVLTVVSDTGRGMNREMIKHIFDPFFTNKEVGKGTGLGLAMVYGIIKNHSGYITCYSELDVGTDFKIYLPALRLDGVDDEVGKKVTTPTRGGSETILLVDDETNIRELAVEVLSRQGYRVVTAGTGEEALEVYGAPNSGIDLVILDISMPGMGGRQCLERLMEMNPEVKVIISSGYSLGGRLSDAINLGAAAFIPKPFSPKDMLATVRKVLDSETA